MRKTKNKMAIDLLFEQQEAEAENVIRGKVAAALLLTVLLVGMLTMFAPDNASASAKTAHVAPDSLVDQFGEE
ncbi:MAG: hypothetical protein RLZZ419_1804 [Pseudomonadota bacterium]|jgi:hypothetical protein